MPRLPVCKPNCCRSHLAWIVSLKEYAALTACSVIFFQNEHQVGKRHVRKGLVISAILISTSAVSRAANDDAQYHEPDAGCLIYSAGGIKFPMQFTFPYNRTVTTDGRTVKDWSGRIEPPPSEFFHAKAKYTDFIGTETGRLFLRCLPPGTYQVGPYSYHGVIPGVASIYWKAANFAPLAFHIRSGEATYIGSFMRAPSLPTSLRPILGARGFFVIADRSSRDLPIAQGRLPAQMKVMKEVLDVSGSTDPALRTSEP